jgi:hypothetical protein
MRTIINFVSHRLQEMPFGLRIVSKVLLVFAFVFPIFTLLLVLPYGRGIHYSVNGASVTYDEFLRRGHFIPFVFIGIYSGILACGFIRAARWSRPLCFLPFAVSFILAFIHHQPPLTVAVYDYLSLSLLVALLAWYLFFRQTVRDYYAKTQAPAA